MEYLNPSPVAALPHTMWLVYRAVMERPRVSADTLLDLLVPEVIRAKTPADGGHVKVALARLRRLELISAHNDELEAAPVADVEAFLRQLRHRIVQPAGTFGPTFDGADDIRKGLIWLMRESPANALDYEADVATRTSVFVNGTRWNTFRIWCDALGFGQAALSVMAKNNAGNRIVPNPTRAVTDAIAHPFGEALPRGEQLPINRLVEFLRQELPVLPGHPSATFEGLNEDEGNALRVIGLALTTAEELDVLTLEYQSDPSGVMALPDAQHGETRYVSTVTIRK
ncbi:MAG: hypothetical protein H0U16_01250 [Actinobacteria bacterium]|nr:hypothetical protein [Actinomycetota bacterium]